MPRGFYYEFPKKTPASSAGASGISNRRRGRQFEYAPAKLSSFCLELGLFFHIFLGKEPNNHQPFRWISFRFKQCLKSIDVGLRDYIHDDLHAERFGLVQARARLRGLNGLSMITLRARPKHRLGRGDRGLR